MGPVVIHKLDLVRLDRIIKVHGLHSSYPVNPIILYDKLETILLRARLPNQRKACCGWHPDYNEPFAIFDPTLTGLDFRHALWHELAHLLFGDIGCTFNFNQRGYYSYQNTERFTELRACYLAIPFWAMKQMFIDGWGITQIAGVLKVTPEMVRMRYGIYLATRPVK